MQDCKQEAGVYEPVIDRNRCEAKGACVTACRFQVFEVRPLDPKDRAGLSLPGKIKAFVHGGRQAYAVGADRCEACGDCIPACPEHAITLRRAG